MFGWGQRMRAKMVRMFLQSHSFVCARLCLLCVSSHVNEPVTAIAPRSPQRRWPMASTDGISRPFADISSEPPDPMAGWTHSRPQLRGTGHRPQFLTPPETMSVPVVRRRGRWVQSAASPDLGVASPKPRVHGDNVRLTPSPRSIPMGAAWRGD